MRQFDLVEYLKNSSRKIVTGDGRKVRRILCIDAKGSYPIVALVERHGGCNYVHTLQHALRLCGLDELADNFKL